MSGARYAELERLLSSLRTTRPVYVPNPGNAGDSLIAHATYQLLDRVLPDYEIGSSGQTYPGRTILYGGGGILTENYQSAAQFIAANHKACETFVLLPHTVSAHGEMIAELGANCHLFCRETRSQAFVREHARKAHVYLSHDLALQADLAKTRADARRLRRTRLYARRFLPRELRLALIGKRHRWRTSRAEVLNAFRNDVEGKGGTPPDNFDVSAVFATRDFSRAGSLETTALVMDFLKPYARVRTNRLHQCILAAMMGKTVDFFPNSYWKNEAVFEHSLKDVYPNVVWRG